MIPKENYYSDAILEQEIARLFLSGFQFAGLSHELANDRDFVCVDFLGTAVVVQNFKGVIKAFQNVCTHRFNRIQTEDRGNSPLRCRYHGWTFDVAGFPVGLPKRDQFLAADGSNAQALCLPEYRVESCGSFVFFTQTDNPLTLADYLGDYWRVLEELSRHIGAETHFAHVPHAANWKLLVENVLECYHCAIVHPETFVTGLGVGLKPIEQVEFSGPHSSSHFPRSETKRENLRKKLLAHLEAREFAHDSFYHVHIFPNLFISSTEGTSFYVGHALPVSAGETRLRMRFFESSVPLDASGRKKQDIINQQATQLGARVIDEDRAILENVQRGMRLSTRPGALGADEIRIQRYMERYETLMA
ncbi:MAG TPA: aromatic ring-hydroxylating dioxygenase subunit alpha [Allosphingosinicella sp.]